MWKELTTLTRLSRPTIHQFRRPQAAPAQTLLPLQRNTTIHTSFPKLKAQKGTTNESEDKTHDRTVLDPQRSEVSKSGSDNEVAAHPAAYDPSKTSPESEIKATDEEARREGKASNPLDMSPANEDVRHWEGPKDGGVERGGESKPSSRGSPRKHGKVKAGGK